MFCDVQETRHDATQNPGNQNPFNLCQCELIFIYNALGYLSNTLDFAGRAVLQTESVPIDETLEQCDIIRRKLYTMLGYE